jgi:pyruvate/2-oxoacid:ferredoxin oxidoreductase alpha subunit
MNTIDDMARWRALAEVIPRPGNDLLNGAEGAYVAVVGMASSKSDLLKKVELALSAMGFDLLNLEDIERVQSIEKLKDADPVLSERFASLRSGNPIEVGTFHTFRS